MLCKQRDAYIRKRYGIGVVLSKGIVLKGCKNGVASNNVISGVFDVGIDIDDCENIQTYGNDIDVYSPSKILRKPIFNRKIGRNEPCPCGSDNKYKKCCGG
jgi:parallel beta-helix repeat protein